MVYSLGESLYHAASSLVYIITGGILNCCIKYFQRPRPSSGGVTIKELDTNEVTTAEENTIALLSHHKEA